eukprot:RCo012857
MSHEIRSPLTGIIGLAELLALTPLSGIQKQYTTSIGLCGKSLLSVVNDVLTFAKLEASKLSLENRWFDLRHCVESAVAVLRGSSQAKPVEVIVDIPCAMPWVVMGDETRLSQVLINLLNNASKFTDEGLITLQLEHRSSRSIYAPQCSSSGLGPQAGESPDPELGLIPEVGATGSLPVLQTRAEEAMVFHVRDTGLGLTAEQSERLFQPFSQADVSTTRQFGGTGLGLSICKQLAELWKGEIGVESE